jgi:streptogramin lyase
MSDELRHRDSDNTDARVERLDALLDAVNAGRPPADDAIDDPELASLLETARALRQSAEPDWPGETFPAQLAERLFQVLPPAQPGGPLPNHREPREWSAPALDPRRRRPASSPRREPLSDDAINEERATMKPTPTLDRPTTEPEAPIELATRRDWAREWAKIAAALLVFIAIGALLVVLLRDDDDQTAVPASTVTPAATVTTVPTQASTQAATATAAPATATVAAVVPTASTAVQPTATTQPTPAVAQGEIAAEISIDGHPWGIAVADGALWVPQLTAGTLARVDLATNSVVATIPIVDANPALLGASSPPMLVAAGDGMVWVTRSLGFEFQEHTWEALRIDPATNQIAQTVPLEVRPYHIAMGEGSVWVTSREQQAVVRFDPASGAVLATIPVNTPGNIVFGGGRVWVAIAASNPATPLETAAEIDPATNQVVKVISTPTDLFGDWAAKTVYPWSYWHRIAWADGALWDSNLHNNAVSRIDPATGEVTATIKIDDVGAIIAAADDLWVYSTILGTVTRIDAATATVEAEYTIVANSGRFNDPANYLAAGDGSVWVANADSGHLRRIDP